jgi:hypothetical protein
MEAFYRPARDSSRAGDSLASRTRCAPMPRARARGERGKNGAFLKVAWLDSACYLVVQKCPIFTAPRLAWATCRIIPEPRRVGLRPVPHLAGGCRWPLGLGSAARGQPGRSAWPAALAGWPPARHAGGMAKPLAKLHLPLTSTPAEKPMRLFRIPWPFVLLLFLTTDVHADAESDARVVIDKAIEAAGGREALSRYAGPFRVERTGKTPNGQGGLKSSRRGLPSGYPTKCEKNSGGLQTAR